MNYSQAPKLVWVDKLTTSTSTAELNLLQDMTVLATARQVLPVAALDWALVTAAEVADEVDELRRSEAILVWEGTGKLERRACAAGVLTTLVSLRSGVPAPHAPEEMLRQIRAAFHQGADLPSIIRFVWSHHSRFQERLLLAQRELAGTEDGGAQLQDLHTRMHQILDTYISDIDAEFRQEQNLWSGGAPAQRRALIEEVIAGEESPADPEQRLGVRLTGSYVFAFIGTRNGTLDEGQRHQLRILSEKTGEGLGAVDGFSQDFGDDSLLWCLAFPASNVEEVSKELKGLRLPLGLQVGVGPVVRGAGDLRRAILGAIESRRVYRHPARPTTSHSAADLVFFDDVQVLSILTRAEDDVAEFLSRTLGDLARNTPKNVDLRRTLLVYLLHSRSRKEAAKILHISPNTVAYRVDQARELAGDRELEASLEVLVALYVLDILPGLIGSDLGDH